MAFQAILLVVNKGKPSDILCLSVLPKTEIVPVPVLSVFVTPFVPVGFVANKSAGWMATGSIEKPIRHVRTLKRESINLKRLLMLPSNELPAPAPQERKRYDLITNYRAGSAIEEMERADDGEWIRFEDVQAELADLTAVRAQLEQADFERLAAEANLAGWLAARQRVRESFQHRDEQGACRCVYCIGDIEGLSNHAAEYELEAWGFKQKLEEAEAALTALRAELETAKLNCESLAAAKHDYFVERDEARAELAEVRARLALFPQDQTNLQRYAPCITRYFDGRDPAPGMVPVSNGEFYSIADVKGRLALPAFITREGHDGTAPAPDESDSH